MVPLFEIDMKMRLVKHVATGAKNGPETRASRRSDLRQKSRLRGILFDQNCLPVTQDKAAQIEGIALGVFAEFGLTR